MKKIKVLSIAVSVLLLLGVFMPCVLGASTVDDLKALGGIIGLDDEDAVEVLESAVDNGNSSVSLSDFFTNSSGVIETIRGLLSGAAANASNSEILGALKALLGGTGLDLTSILSSLTNGDMLNQLQAYLAGENITTQPAETTTVPETTTLPEPTTEPTTTQPVTEASTTRQSSSSGSQSSYTQQTYAYTPSTTKAAETTTYAYVAPQIVTAAPVTEDVFSPVVTDDIDDGGVSVKMVIGIVILAISGAAVVAVAIVLKKTRV